MGDYSRFGCVWSRGICSIQVQDSGKSWKCFQHKILNTWFDCVLVFLVFSRMLVTFAIFMQRYMDSEIRAIMAQYMPLDNHGEAEHLQQGHV